MRYILLTLLLIINPLFNGIPEVKLKVKSIKTIHQVHKIDTCYNYAIKVIKKYEKYSQKRYELFGDRYIGYGHLLYKSDTLTRLTEKQADSLVRVDFDKAIKQVETLIKYHIPYNRKMVLAMFTFNCGAGKLQKSTLLKLMNQKEPYQVIKEQYYKYVFAKGKYLPNMKKRRYDEFKIWE
jgi:lysozyme